MVPLTNALPVLHLCNVHLLGPNATTVPGSNSNSSGSSVLNICARWFKSIFDIVNEKYSILPF